MKKRSLRSLSLCSLLCILPISTSAQDNVSPPPVSRADDLIIGSPDAETTLLIYGSPGCMGCIDAIVSIFEREEIQSHLGAFDLRMVVRHVHPSFLSLGQINQDEQALQRAAQFTVGLSNIMACLAEDPGGIDLVLGYGYLQAFARGGVDQNPDLLAYARWPFLSQEETADFLEGFWIWEDNLNMTEEQIRKCSLSPDLQERVWTRLGTNYVELVNEGWQPSSFPVIFIDGSQHAWNGAFDGGIEALAEAVTDAVTRAGN